jgi:AcrR family transcriptional regulator
MGASHSSLRWRLRQAGKPRAPDSHPGARGVCAHGRPADNLNKDDASADELEFAHPLPRGRHRLEPEQVAENQRQRLIAAMARSIAVRGYAATTVDRVLEGSGVSRGTFYELFGNRHDCLLAAHEASLELLMERISAACAGEGKWAVQVAAAVHAAVDFADRAPDRARLLVLDAFTADAGSSRQALASFERLARMLRAGRRHHPRAATLPETTERALVGAVATAIGWQLLSGDSPADLEDQLAYFVLAPYLGTAAARRLAAQS